MCDQNLVFDANGYLKLVDFGFAKRLDQVGCKTYTLCGTPEYISPEVLSGKGHDCSCDLWGVGVLLYEMLFGAQLPVRHCV